MAFWKKKEVKISFSYLHTCHCCLRNLHAFQFSATCTHGARRTQIETEPNINHQLIQLIQFSWAATCPPLHIFFLPNSTGTGTQAHYEAQMKKQNMTMISFRSWKLMMIKILCFFGGKPGFVWKYIFEQKIMLVTCYYKCYWYHLTRKWELHHFIRPTEVGIAEKTKTRTRL